jgi:hypothetical protein
LVGSGKSLPNMNSHCSLATQTTNHRQLKVTIRPTVSLPDCRGIEHQSGGKIRYLLSVADLVMWRTLHDERMGLSLQLMITLTSVGIHGSKPRWTHDHILLSQIRGSQNTKGQASVLKFPGTGWSNYILFGYNVLFCCLLWLTDIQNRYSKAQVEVKAILQATICRPVSLGVRHPSRVLLSGSYSFVDMG